MQIKHEQLNQKLAQNKLPVIWISGDEPLLLQEACDSVRLYTREQGFGEREVLDVVTNFNWSLLQASGSDLSLFAERKLIELRLNQSKLDEPARAALMQYLENPNPDNLLLLTTAKVDKTSQSTKWFKALESQCLFCPIWPVSEAQLPGWISQRLQALGMNADQETLQLLADKVEGNLLAAAQEVEKLRVLSNSDKLDVDTVVSVVSDSSRFSIYSLTDACLGGNSDRALKILNHLEAEGEQCLFILAMLCKEIRGLSAMLSDIADGHNMHGVMQNHRVWSNRTQMVTHALEQHNQSTLLRLLDKARKVDQSVKGLLELRPWDELASLVLGFSNSRLLVGVV